MNALIISDTTAVRMNVIADRTQNLLIAGVKAMMIEQLKEKLRNGIAHFVFIKKDGSVRHAFGTTMGSLAKAHTVGGARSSTKVMHQGYAPMLCTPQGSCTLYAKLYAVR